MKQLVLNKFGQFEKMTIFENEYPNLLKALEIKEHSLSFARL